ncbi:hypothetical protein AUJ65_02965 [Candidatus Micrarchaeota archaeon CG1_02_51_15]|nr:MAG: hypothetical protein AUJ65_02965 [Candidatus Micrarchaeota archaeon CG1_02_51_15]
METKRSPRVKAQAFSHVGGRKNNEDRFHAKTDLFVVADGMEGYPGGEHAAEIACESFAEKHGEIIKSGNPGEELLKTFRHAQQKIEEAQSSTSSHGAMGSTVAAVALKNGVAHAVHAGDTRVYHYDWAEKKLKQVTADHTWAQALIDKGLPITKNHPGHSQLTQFLGGHRNRDSVFLNKADYNHFSVSRNDAILICSDGLHSLLSDEEIKKEIAKPRLTWTNVAKALVAKAHKKALEQARLEGKKPHHDNITALFVRVKT